MKNKKLPQNQTSTRARLLAPTANSPQTGMHVKPSHDEMAKRAYFMYLNHGCPQGQDVQHWLEAEVQTMAASNQQGCAS